MTKRLLLTLLTFLISAQLTFSQWVAQMHSPVSAQSLAMKTDDAENVYIAGVFSQTLTLLGAGFVLANPFDTQQIANTTLTGASPTLTGILVLDFPANDNVFLAKYTKDGVLLWAKQLGQISTQNEPRRNYLSLQVDGVGNSYLFAYWNANCTMSGFDCDTRKPGLIKFKTDGSTDWVKYANPAASVFEGYLEMSTKDEELFLNFSATTAFTFGGAAFSSGGKTFSIKGDGTQKVVSELSGASPMLIYPCGNVLYRYGNNQIYRDSANTVGRSVLSITGGAGILKLEVDSLGYLSGIGKFKTASINVAGETLTNSRPTLVNTSTPGWDMFAFKIKKTGEKVWARNIITWETGTGNGYIGMALNSAGEIQVAFTADVYMSVTGRNTKYFYAENDGIYFTLSDQGSYVDRRNISYINQTTGIGHYSKITSAVYFSSDHKNNFTASFLQNNKNIYLLNSLGNGIVIGKGTNGSPPPPPPFSTKYLYCNTVTSSLPGTALGIDLKVYSSIKVYPNPNEGTFTIFAGYEGESSYIIYDMLGALVSQGLFQNENQIVLKTKGVFIVEIHQKDKKYRQKIVVY